MKPTEKQIALYKQIRQITEKHHAYSDQMMELAIWIDSEFEQKGKRRELLIEYHESQMPRVRESHRLYIENCVDKFLNNL